MHFAPKPLQLELWEWPLFCHNGEERFHVYFKQHTESKDWSSLLKPEKFCWVQWKLYLKSQTDNRIRSCLLFAMPIGLIAISKLMFICFCLNEAWECSSHSKEVCYQGWNCPFLSTVLLLDWVDLDTSDNSHYWNDCSQAKRMWQKKEIAEGVKPTE